MHAHSCREAFAFSLHSFTTLGYGSVFPHASCVGAQLVVLLEFWVGIFVVGISTAVIFSKFLRPSPIVSFSKNCLISEDADGTPMLCFRFMPVTHTSLVNLRIEVAANIFRRDAEGRIASGYNVKLKLKNSSSFSFFQFAARHRIDEV